MRFLLTWPRLGRPLGVWGSEAGITRLRPVAELDLTMEEAEDEDFSPLTNERRVLKVLTNEGRVLKVLTNDRTVLTVFDQ